MRITLERKINENDKIVLLDVDLWMLIYILLYNGAFSMNLNSVKMYADGVEIPKPAYPDEELE